MKHDEKQTVSLTEKDARRIRLIVYGKDLTSKGLVTSKILDLINPIMRKDAIKKHTVDVMVRPASKVNRTLTLRPKKGKGSSAVSDSSHPQRRRYSSSSSSSTANDNNDTTTTISAVNTPGEASSTIPQRRSALCCIIV